MPRLCTEFPPPGVPGLPQPKAAWPCGLIMRILSGVQSLKSSRMSVPIQHLLTETSNPLIKLLPAASSLPDSSMSSILFSEEQAVG